MLVRESVRDTIARYNHFGDRGRFDDMVDQFQTDGVLELLDFDARHVGREALRTFFASVANDFAASDRPLGHLRHCVTNTVIEIDGPDLARADSYFQVITDAGLDHWGRYRDRLTPNGSRWLLAHRSVRTDGWAPHSPFRPAPAG